jgi:hypothetical protein
MKASVIIVDTEAQGLRLSCVHILCAQDFPAAEYEVLLPDMGGWGPDENELLESVQRQYPHFKVLRAPGKNRSELMDLAAREAKGELLLFTESHCQAHRGWLAFFVDLFEREKRQIVQGKFKTLPRSSLLGDAEENMIRKVFRRMKELKIDGHFFDTHNSAILKSLYVRLGGFAPELPFGCEFDLGARAHQEGVPIPLLEDNWVWHIYNTPLRDYCYIIEQQGRDRARLLKLRGREYVEKYFPMPGLVRRQSFLRAFRWPLVGLFTLLLAATAAAFRLASALKMRGLAFRLFETFANHSARRGMLKGLA